MLQDPVQSQRQCQPPHECTCQQRVDFPASAAFTALWCRRFARILPSVSNVLTERLHRRADCAVPRLENVRSTSPACPTIEHDDLQRKDLEWVNFGIDWKVFPPSYAPSHFRDISLQKLHVLLNSNSVIKSQLHLREATSAPLLTEPCDAERPGPESISPEDVVAGFAVLEESPKS